MEQDKYSVRKDEILDNILGLLLSFEAPDFKDIFKKTNARKINMDFIANALPYYQWEKDMKCSFKTELLNQAFVFEDGNNNLHLTDKGRVFKKSGGYYSLSDNQIQEQELETHFLKMEKKYNRKQMIVEALIILVFFILITIIKNLFQ